MIELNASPPQGHSGLPGPASAHRCTGAWLRRRSWLALLVGGPTAPWAAPEPGPRLRMGYFDRYPPLSQLTNANQMEGLLIDLVDAVGSVAGLRFSHHGFPWARAQGMVERGELDGLCTNATPVRQVYATFCATPVVVATMGLFFRRDDDRPRQLNSVIDMRALRQGSYRGSGFAQQHLEPDRIAFDHDAESVLRRIALGDLDIYVGDDLVTAPQIRRLGLAERLDYRPLSFLPASRYCWGVRRSFPDAEALVQRMEAATQQAQRQGVLKSILKRYA